MSNRTLGAEQDKRAPWNEKDPIKAKVLVTLTISKTVTIETTEYEKYKDGPSTKLGTEVLEDCVYEQVTLPHDLAHVFKDMGFNLSSAEERALEDASGWEVDEINVEQV